MKLASVPFPYCQKVLPTVYDNSLSYYEAICKLSKCTQEIVDRLNEWYEIAEQLEQALGDINDMKSDILRLKDDITVINNNFTELESYVNSINEYAKSLEGRISNNEDAIAELITQMANFDANVDTKLDALERKLTRMIETINSDFKDELTILQLKVNQMKVNLQNQIDELRTRVDNIDTSVINPWHIELGKITPQKNTNFTYNDLADETLTARDYCKLGLDADGYKSFSLTAMEYVKHGKERLHYYWVCSPAYGFWQEVNNVFTSVLNFICDTLSADEYSIKDMTADEYTALNIDAQQYYYWRGSGEDKRVKYDSIFTGLTRAQYRHMKVDDSGNVSVSESGNGITSGQYNKLNLDSDNGLIVDNASNGIERQVYERLGVVET